MKKKWSLFLIAALLMLQSVQAMAVTPFQDTMGTPCETATEVLAALEIIEGSGEGVFEPEKNLTRAEMVTIILRALHMEDALSKQNIFTDVPDSHWANASIAAAFQMGIVNGMSETIFQPDGLVTYEQAVKMIIEALGYGVPAEAAGGYPGGYLAKASQLGILNQMNVTNTAITRGDMAILLYNALEVPLLQKNVFGSDTLAFIEEKNDTLLSFYHKVSCTNDMVVTTAHASLIGENTHVNADEVITEKGVRMLSGNSNAKEMLGLSAKFYTKEDALLQKPVIIALIPRKSAESVVINAQNIENADAESLSYTDENGAVKKADISGAVFVYNGAVKHLENDSISAVHTGTIRLVMNSGSVTAVIAESFENYIVNSVNAETDTIGFKEGKGALTIDFTDRNCHIVMTDEKGKALTVDDIVEWDVLSVAKDADVPTKMRIYRSYNKATGVVSEISEKEVIIGGKIYSIADGFDTKALKIGKDVTVCLDFTNAVAAVDESYTATRTYGWLKQVSKGKGLNETVQLKIFTSEGVWKVFSVAEKLQFNQNLSTAADVLTLDTESGNNVYKKAHTPMLFDATGEVIPQLISYETNDTGEINVLETATNLTMPSLADEEKIGGTFSMDWYANNAPGAYSGGYVSLFNGTPAGAEVEAGTTEAAGTTYFGRVVADTNTKAFIIPGNTEDDKLYKVRGPLGLQDWRDMSCVSLYDVSDAYRCGAIVVRNDISQSNASTDVYPEANVASAIVTGSSIVLDEDGVPVTTLKLKSYTGGDVQATVTEEDFNCLYCYANADLAKDPDWYAFSISAPNKIYTYENVREFLALGTRSAQKVSMYLPIEKLEPGDVIQYELDEGGNLKTAMVVFRANYGGGVEFSAKISSLMNDIAVSSRNNFYTGAALQVHGNVTAVRDTGIFVKVNIANTLGQKTAVTATHAMRTDGAFFLWDAKRNELRTISPEAVTEGDEIFSLWATDRQRMFIVYRREKANTEVWK